MKTFNPISEIKKFENKNVKEWQDSLRHYDYEQLRSMIGILMVINFYTAKTLQDLKKFAEQNGL